MPLYLRRLDKKIDRYEIVNAAGYGVGTIQHEPHVPSELKWGWYINGEIVAPQVRNSGRAVSLNEAKVDLAKHWREWLKLNGLAEDHQPKYG